MTAIFTGVTAAGYSSVIDNTSLVGHSLVINTSGGPDFSMLVQESDDGAFWVETACIDRHGYSLFIPTHTKFRCQLQTLGVGGVLTATLVTA